jgi:hypothetical protein
VAGSGECGDEPSGCGAMELVSVIALSGRDCIMRVCIIGLYTFVNNRSLFSQ